MHNLLYNQTTPPSSLNMTVPLKSETNIFYTGTYLLDPLEQNGTVLPLEKPWGLNVQDKKITLTKNLIKISDATSR